MSEPEDEIEEQPARAFAAGLPRLLVVEPAREKDRKGRRFCWYVEPVELMFTTWAPICLTCGKHVRWLGPPERRGMPQGPDAYVYQVSCGCKGKDGWSQVDELITDWPLRVYAREQKM